MHAKGTQSFLNHIVGGGETLDILAERYSTTVESIVAVNYKMN